MGQNIIYLDYDGPMHHHEVYWQPSRGVYIKDQPSRRLFEHAPLLVSLLQDHPKVKIVLSTSWVKSYGCEKTAKRLPQPLRERVVGATFHSQMWRQEFESLSRGRQIWNDVCRRQPAKWLALDDDVANWPDACIDNLIPVDGDAGLSDPQTLETLRQRLEGWR